MDLELKGKTALITGASRGLGLAAAQGLAREGVDLHLASRSQADLDTARAAILAECKVSVECHALDLGVSANMQELARRCPAPDILVNNAGAIPAGDLFAVDEARWRTAWDLKVFGYINLSRIIYAGMKARRDGVIVNVIGVAGERPRSTYIAGTTGNAAMMAFTRALGSESVDHNVRVIGINPGQIETDRLRDRLMAQAKVQLGSAERWRELVKDAPLGRLGRPDEIGDAVVYLASARASYISGTILTVDAGRASRNRD